MFGFGVILNILISGEDEAEVVTPFAVGVWSGLRWRVYVSRFHLINFKFNCLNAQSDKQR